MNEYLITYKNGKADSIFADDFDEAEEIAIELGAVLDGILISRIEMGDFICGKYSNAIN